MHVYLDDQPVDLEGQSLPAILASARNRLAQQGRIVTEVRLGDRTLTPDELNSADLAQQSPPLSGGGGEGELRLYSATPADLAAQALQQVRLELSRARQTMQEAADLLQKDQQSQALELVGQAMGIWQQAQQAVLQSVTLLGLHLDQLVLGDQPLPALLQDTLAQLRTLRDLLAVSDSVGLADALGYEWTGLTQRWEEVIDRLVDHIQQR